MMSLFFIYFLIANETRLSPRKKRARSSCCRRRAKCKMTCVALKSSSSKFKRHTHACRYIFYFARHCREKHAHVAF